jgi:hypothetical protein
MDNGQLTTRSGVVSVVNPPDWMARLVLLDEAEVAEDFFRFVGGFGDA